ncbi:lipid IV(A) 3-deoxy-D-manno-octulosonic acid transferase [Rudaea sp.]|uniref:lipid IV(A) 3-deoxy-D-manno-octulosonic acid transferase n=1 Tax=Rudaea sp. TaxID=2136325 RepID=UPI002ED33057
MPRPPRGYTSPSFIPPPHVPLRRLLYTLTMYLLTPAILYRLAVRGLRYREYFDRWRERFGHSTIELKESIWIHAVSMGEVNAALPLIDALMARYADMKFVITTVTPTGSERVRRVYGDRVVNLYLPYDLPTSIARFLDRVRPRVALIMETEIWPNLFFECEARGIPLIIANARLSEKSLRGYSPIRPLVKRALAGVSYIAAQSATDATRFAELGAPAEHLGVIGNLKYDMSVPKHLLEEAAAMRDAWGARRPVWIAASTHDGEELPVLKAHAEVLRRFPDALMLLVPRHPERFKPVALACRSFGFVTRTRSEDGAAKSDTQCFVVDTLGELLNYYAAADVAFVGGSLVPIGGHNVLEPAALAVPIVVGPYMFNFAEINQSLTAAGASLQVLDGDELGAAITRLFADGALRKRVGQAAQQAFEREQGSVLRTLAIVEKALDNETAKKSG